MKPLRSRRCVPCEGGVPRLSLLEAKKLLPEVPHWKLLPRAAGIQREFRFIDFADAVIFITEIAELAEDEGHHPDLFLHSYNRLVVTLSTHAIKGLSENDFILAAKIDSLGGGEKK